jgi:hypothetical protein
MIKTSNQTLFLNRLGAAFGIDCGGIVILPPLTLIYTYIRAMVLTFAILRLNCQFNDCKYVRKGI